MACDLIFFFLFLLLKGDVIMRFHFLPPFVNSSTPTTGSIGTTETTVSSLGLSSTTLDECSAKYQIIGNYRLTKTIGRGVSGKVKLGIHIHTGEQVAIKIIPRHTMNQSSIVAQAVERELAILQLLDHPHLVELQQVMQDSTNVYFVMEYMDGGELHQVLTQRRGRRLSEHEARSYFTQITNALAWCHTHHICHRDLKLENILLNKNKKTIKIADFGMAIMQPTSTLLRTSCGSPHYASPEIIKGIPYHGPATDVWSCGVILYILLTGYHPFEDKRTSRLLYKIKSGQYRRLPSDISSSAKDLLEKMLTVNPSKRINIHDVLAHAWMLPQSQFGGFPDPWFQYDQLTCPLVNQSCVIEGWVWETLKILWRDMGTDRILASLKSHGPNVQKLTYRLLVQRNDRLLGRSISNDNNDNNDNSTNNNNNNSSSSGKNIIPIPVSTTAPIISPGSYLSNSTTLYESSSPPFSPTCWSTETTKPISLTGTKNTSMTNPMYSHQPIHLCTEKQDDRVSSSTSILTINTSSIPPLLPLPSLLEQQQLKTYDSKQHRHLLWYPFYFNCKTNRLMQHTVKSANVMPSLSFGSTPLSLSNTTDSAFSPSSTTISVLNASRSALSLSVSPSTLDTSSFSFTTGELFGNTVRYCKRLYQQTHSLLSGIVGKKGVPTKVFAIGCSARNAWEAAGKLHQVLEENYSGRLCHRGYSYGQMVWTGSIQLSDEKKGLYFVCYIPNVSSARRVRVNFSLVKGDAMMMKEAMEQLLKTLNEYERQAMMVTNANGWQQQQRQ
ncbi:kinase-like domain-containing protein [Halteromyces radiatus]|uniref:kinase-like domain-containing protein n=1 Tax=Halteromyces radiatus TaxID=101107 RepID=UPI002220D9D1|nr:kinase-like domain-containing protein [Halteromyces radiatus]KAI8096593.1 kinase-like domain-containing protein [Halteromyces radiatus]